MNLQLFFQWLTAFLASFGINFTPPQSLPPQPPEVPPITQSEPTKIPSPALLPGLIATGIAAWRKRNNEQNSTTDSEVSGSEED